ncbi:unnamed protein product [Sphagnum jensenii]|uniref:Uncharacterized protein n=1 Tax=Sphagnum jensenii TaxID=128206 RepID=A0ABP0V7K5_9BRYO
MSPYFRVPVAAPEGELAIDGALVAALLQTVKGKKLVTRSFALLPPEKRWVLVQPVLTRVLQAEVVVGLEEQGAEVKLVGAVQFFFKQALLHASALQDHSRTAAGGPGLEAAVEGYISFVQMVLAHFRQCLKGVIVTFMGGQQLRRALRIDEPGMGGGQGPENHRLQLFRSLIASGDRLAAMLLSAVSGGRDAKAGATRAEEWRQIKETFLELLGGGADLSVVMD